MIENTWLAVWTMTKECALILKKFFTDGGCSASRLSTERRWNQMLLDLLADIAEMRNLDRQNLLSHSPVTSSAVSRNANILERTLDSVPPTASLKSIRGDSREA
ncbi:MAG TPA: hypothetical protein VIH76_05245 [Candidatus Acidoferrales bacterium]